MKAKNCQHLWTKQSTPNGEIEACGKCSTPRDSWHLIDDDNFPHDNEEVLCWNGERTTVGIYRCDDRFQGKYEFEVQKYHSSGDRTIVTYWVNVTMWRPMPSPQ